MTGPDIISALEAKARLPKVMPDRMLIVVNAEGVGHVVLRQDRDGSRDVVADCTSRDAALAAARLLLL